MERHTTSLTGASQGDLDASRAPVRRMQATTHAGRRRGHLRPRAIPCGHTQRHAWKRLVSIMARRRLGRVCALCSEEAADPAVRAEAEKAAVALNQSVVRREWVENLARLQRPSREAGPKLRGRCAPTRAALPDGGVAQGEGPHGATRSVTDALDSLAARLRATLEATGELEQGPISAVSAVRRSPLSSCRGGLWRERRGLLQLSELAARPCDHDEEGHTDLTVGALCGRLLACRGACAMPLFFFASLSNPSHHSPSSHRLLFLLLVRLHRSLSISSACPATFSSRHAPTTPTTSPSSLTRSTAATSSTSHAARYAHKRHHTLLITSLSQLSSLVSLLHSHSAFCLCAASPGHRPLVRHPMVCRARAAR